MTTVTQNLSILDWLSFGVAITSDIKQKIQKATNNTQAKIQ